jgi:Ca2+-dependent lipid-binding protein
VVGSSTKQSPEEYRKTQDDTAPPDAVPGTTDDVPLKGEATNVLFHPTPAVDFAEGYKLLEKYTSSLCLMIIIGIIVATWLFRKYGFIGSVVTSIAVSGGVWFWMKRIQEEAESLRWHTERARGQTAQLNLIPESVEWMNSLVRIVWGLVNPDMFASMADTLEDVMQASVPSIIVHLDPNAR